MAKKYKENSKNIYEHALYREKKARQLSENLLEDKTRELYFAKQKLEEQNVELKRQAAESKLLLAISHFNDKSDTSFNEAMKHFIDAVCDLSGWPVGHVFFVSDESDLISSDIWHLEKPEYAGFKEITSKIHFFSGVGLPGRVLKTGKDIWIEDVCSAANFPRKAVCKDLGIHGAFASPVMRYDKLVAIVEFFSSELRPKDEALMKAVRSAIFQLGIMLERKQAEFEAEVNHRKLQRALAEVQQLANYDWLTGLPNRLSFEETLKRELAKAERNNYNVILLFIDLDDFKKINDSLGHDVGDSLLQKVAQRLKINLRTADFIARIGGDEFAIILTHVDLASVKKVAVKLLAVLKDPFPIADNICMISASIGIATSESESSISLSKNADIALYEAKDTGRNKYRIFTTRLRQKYLQKLNFENNLKLALKENEFFLLYQPIYQLQPMKLVGFEALLRWQHKKHGVMTPDIFVPVAEELGLMVKIGEQVLQAACQQYVEWHPYLRKLMISINVSAQQLLDNGFIELMANILSDNQLPTHNLVLEITETVAMTNQVLAEKQIKKLNKLGIKISIDDFGTGYSSLSLLKRLPIHILKIDRSFIFGLGTNENDTAIVQSTIALAKTLGLEVIAEGVEKKEQLKFLIDVGCSQAQGFYFGKPLTNKQAERLIQTELRK